MARSTTDIVYNVTGQTFEYRVPQGRPTSATFSVFNDTADDDATAEFTGTATVTDPSTTVDVASGPAQTDPQKVSLAATTGIALGRKYLLSEGSRQEWVSPIQIVSADYIRARHALKNDYTTSATFVSTTITGAVDSTWVAAEENISDHKDPNPGYRVRWEIVVSGVTYVAYTFLDLIRTRISYEVDIDDLNARAPGLSDSLPIEYRVEQGRPLLEAAWQSVKAKLASVSIDTDALRNDEVLDELVTLKALAILAMGGWRPAGYESQAEYVADTRGEFDRFWEQHFQASLKQPLAVGSGGGADRVFSQPVWVK